MLCYVITGSKPVTLFRYQVTYGGGGAVEASISQ